MNVNLIKKFHFFLLIYAKNIEALNDIYCKLTCEDQTLRTFRRALGLGQYVQNDLIPFLINVKDRKLNLPNSVDYFFECNLNSKSILYASSQID